MNTQWTFFKWSYEHDRTRHWTKSSECVDFNLNTSDWPLCGRNQQTCLWLATLLTSAKVHFKIIWRFPKQKIHRIVRQIYFVMLLLQRKLIMTAAIITLQPKTGCPLKLSQGWAGQYLDGRPPEKTRFAAGRGVSETSRGCSHCGLCGS